MIFLIKIEARPLYHLKVFASPLQEEKPRGDL